MKDLDDARFEIDRLIKKCALYREALELFADINNYDGDSAFSTSVFVKPGLAEYMNGYAFAKHVLYSAPTYQPKELPNAK